MAAGGAAVGHQFLPHSRRGDSYRLREKRRAGLIKTTRLHQEQLA
jgi:hypothetical protein